MAAVLGRTEIGIKQTGVSVTVPNSPKAKLMYYLNSMTSVLDLGGVDPNLTRLCDYPRHYLLTEDETDKLILLCFLLSPDVLANKCIFQDDEMCGNMQNQFYELSATRHNFLVTESILIGGQRRAVHKIMVFKAIWLKENWLDPMQVYESRLAALASGNAQGRVTGAPSTPAITYTSTSTPSYNYQRQPVYTSASDDGCCCTIL